MNFVSKFAAKNPVFIADKHLNRRLQTGADEVKDLQLSLVTHSTFT
jgi:hypothetical protein